MQNLRNFRIYDENVKIWFELYFNINDFLNLVYL